MTFALSIKTAEDLAAEAAEATQARIVAAIDAHVESQARLMGYNSAAHLASYVASSVPAWASEAQVFVAWRDAVWIAAFALQSQHAAAQTVPTVAEAIAALPAWGEQ